MSGLYQNSIARAPRRIGLLILLVGLMACSNKIEYADYVDPFLGSVHARWFFFTPASVPMGMAKLGPHTDAHYGNEGGWQPIGYDYRHSSIEGFGHFHEFQIGGLVVMPTTGRLITQPGDTNDISGGYRSTFSKEKELAEPGYYKVFLDDYSIDVELTATKRVGFHRITYPKTNNANLIFNIGNQQGESGHILDAYVNYTEQNEIEGYIVSYPAYVENYDPDCDVRMYYVIRPGVVPESFGTFTGDYVFPLARTAMGPGCGFFMSFETTGKSSVEMQVGLSYTSIENARENLIAETKNTSFDGVRMAARKEWNSLLGKMKASGGTEENLKKFYTGLYHVLLGRGISHDISGAYPRCDGAIGQIPLDDFGNPMYAHFNSDATWGSFWNIQQVWALAYPGIYSDYVRCHLDHYKDCGWLPDGIAQGCYVPGVPSNFLSVAIAGAWNRGIRDFDIDLAYKAVVKNETGWENRPVGVGKYDTFEFVTNGYIPNDVIWRGWNFSGSHTLEYSFSAFAASELARQLGKNDDYNMFRELANGYRHLFDTSTNFMRPKERDGTFMKDFSPEAVWQGFQEGNPWQYSWYVPHDVAGLISLMGEEKFNQRLDSIFSESEKTLFGGGKELDSFSGLAALYNHGNQPSLHIPFLFNYSGKPWLTQKWSRRICDVFYGSTPVHGYGYGQDEDQGQLGAWFVMAATGLFDVQGGANHKPTFQIGSPMFDKMEIALDNNYYSGNIFSIIANRKNPESIYIDKVLLNGHELDRPWLFHEEITRGGKLELFLTDSPNKEWGKAQDVRPPSMSEI